MAAQRVPPPGAGHGSGGKRISARDDDVKRYGINGKPRLKLPEKVQPNGLRHPQAGEEHTVDRDTVGYASAIVKSA